jgi:pectinesterase
MKKTGMLLLGIALVYRLAAQRKIVVSQDGSGDYATVQQALDAVRLHNTEPVTIYIKKGTYKEKLHLDSTRDFVTLVGEDELGTLLTFDDHTGKVSADGQTINTRSSHSFMIRADHFTARNLTFQNDAGFTAGQAVAVESDGDQARFYHCRFVGFQDVLFTNNENSRQYYKDCYIEGTTDFIFGSATVWFEHCHIYSKKNSHVTAASTPQEHRFGYIFHDCTLTGDTSLHQVSLGRPWRPFASVTYIHCYLGPDIKPEGWSNWNQTENYKTARFAEYDDYGPGARIEKRIPWSKQLTRKEIRGYTVKKVFSNWDPGT